MHRKCAILLLIGAINEVISLSFESHQESATKKLERDEVSEELIKRSEDTLKIIDNEDVGAEEKKRGRVFFAPSYVDSKGSDCCGSRYGPGFPGRPEAGIGNGFGAPSEGGRYPSRFGNRPGNRYDGQSPSYPLTGNPGRPGGGSLYGESHGEGDIYGEGNRYDTRPSYGSGIIRPIGTIAPIGPPGFGGNSEVGGRPPGSIGRPGYGGRPGAYGVSGSFDGGGHFGEPGYIGFPEAGVAHGPGGNINSHKALALKALAGVALIGAAAALASNPVLLPIGVVSGRRRKRSNFEEVPGERDYRLKALETRVSKMKGDFHDDATTFSKCVAKLACEIQSEYVSYPKKRKGNSNKDGDALRRFTKLYERPVARYISNLLFHLHPSSFKKLIKSSVSAGLDGQNCSAFACDVTTNARYLKSTHALE